MNKAIALVAFLGLTSIAWAETDREATNDRLDHAGSVLRVVMPTAAHSFLDAVRSAKAQAVASN